MKDIPDISSITATTAKDIFYEKEEFMLENNPNTLRELSDLILMYLEDKLFDIEFSTKKSWVVKPIRVSIIIIVVIKIITHIFNR